MPHQPLLSFLLSCPPLSTLFPAPPPSLQPGRQGVTLGSLSFLALFIKSKLVQEPSAGCQQKWEFRNHISHGSKKPIGIHGSRLHGGCQRSKSGGCDRDSGEGHLSQRKEGDTSLNGSRGQDWMQPQEPRAVVASAGLTLFHTETALGTGNSAGSSSSCWGPGEHELGFR